MSETKNYAQPHGLQLLEFRLGTIRPDIYHQPSQNTAGPPTDFALPAAIDILEDTLPRIDHTTLVKYGLEYKVGAVIKRLGWILEQLGVPQNELASLQRVPRGEHLPAQSSFTSPGNEQ